ncbi:hypothetical protein ACNI3T_00620 [Christiangramia sp. ASW11-125]|uniref:hypothetical protein n=1 Tax=Christiangramia sp. ASW11-125 TaxID=3400701 RepID=UPI003AAC0E51
MRIKLTLKLIIINLLLISCSNSIPGELIERKIDLKDFGKNEKWEFIGQGMDNMKLRKKYGEDVLRQFDFHMASSCEPFLKFKDSKLITLKNSSTNKEFRFTIQTTKKTFRISPSSEGCYKPIMENPTIEYDDIFKTLDPGETKIVGVEKMYQTKYLDGNYDGVDYIEVEYKITGAREDN